MSLSPGASITAHFVALTAPRVERTKDRPLLDLLTIALCAVISGAVDWVAMEAFGKAERSWFDTFLILPNGIPSHDTFGRVFAALDPDQFRTCFLGWVQSDMAFREDESRTRVGASAENLTERTAKLRVTNRRLRAAWDEQYLLTVLRR